MSQDNEKIVFNNIMKEYIGSLKYDFRKIDNENSICEHPLRKYISSTVKIGKEDKNGVGAYLEHAGVVFDPNTYNFHIFPNLSKDYKPLVEYYTKLRRAIIDTIKNDEQFEEYKSTVDKSSDKFYYKNRSGCGAFCRFFHVEKALEIYKKKPSPDITAAADGNVYRFVEVIYKGCSYTINFMRYTFDGKKVGCTMNEIQFHKECIPGINKGTDGTFDICYPETDQDYASCSNSAENICFNPPIKFPKDTNDAINEIIRNFICFIENSGLPLDNKNEGKYNADCNEYVERNNNPPTP